MYFFDLKDNKSLLYIRSKEYNLITANLDLVVYLTMKIKKILFDASNRFI
jgi:hypothetical protein